MKRIVKILAYVVLIACAVSFGYAFITHLPKAKEIQDVDEPGTVATPATTNTAPATNTVVATNLPAASTNKVRRADPLQPNRLPAIGGRTSDYSCSPRSASAC